MIQRTNIRLLAGLAAAAHLALVAGAAFGQMTPVSAATHSDFEQSLTVLNGAELSAEFPCQPNCRTSSLPAVAREAWLIWRRHPDAQSYTLSEASPCLIESNRLPTDTVALVRIIVQWQPNPEPPVTCDVRVNAVRNGHMVAQTRWVRIRIRRIFK